MLWFGKKKKEEQAQEDDILYSESVDENITEEEILEALTEEDEAGDSDDALMFDTSVTENLENSEESSQSNGEDEPEESDESIELEESSESDIKVTRIINTFNELCEYVSKKPIGCIQYMRKENKEVFQLRETHLRIASSWGSISMARDYSERDYAKIVLANDVLFNPSDFYILPMLTDEERENAIKTFCMENYAENGKKYAKNPDKFSKLVNEKNDTEKWIEFTKGLICSKLEAFCSKNEILFDD